jgi:hypothetical protein
MKVFSRFARRPFVLTLHGPHDATLSDYYSHYPDVHYVAISNDQAHQESLPNLRTIHNAGKTFRYFEPPVLGWVHRHHRRAMAGQSSRAPDFVRKHFEPRERRTLSRSRSLVPKVPASLRIYSRPRSTPIWWRHQRGRDKKFDEAMSGDSERGESSPCQWRAVAVTSAESGLFAQIVFER